MTGAAPDVVVVGAGIAGIAAAVELTAQGKRVLLLERRAFLGGRATSFVDKDTGEEIDNCQHIVLGCCTNVLDLFRILGVLDRIEWSDAFTYVTPDAKRHVIRPVPLPAPLHFLPSLLAFGAVDAPGRLGIIGALLRMAALDGAALLAARDRTMADWLAAAGQSRAAIERFWRPILVSAVNEDIERASALPCLQVFLQGFMPARNAASMGVPKSGLASLYAEPAESYLRAKGSAVRSRAKVESFLWQDGRIAAVRLANGETVEAAAFVLAVPPDAAADLLRGTPAALANASGFEYSPIVGIHLWYDRPVLDIPHAVLLDTTVHWVFKKPVDEQARELGAAERVQVVVSAARPLKDLGQKEIADIAARELAAAFPAARDAKVVKAVVVKENRATCSFTPAVERLRPGPKTAFENLVLAGDWTKTGWPATLEGAVRSGRLAAAALLGRDAGSLVPDLARAPLAKLVLYRSPLLWPA